MNEPFDLQKFVDATDDERLAMLRETKTTPEFFQLALNDPKTPPVLAMRALRAATAMLPQLEALALALSLTMSAPTAGVA